MPDYETLLVRKEDGVAWVSLNRPDVRNAINRRMQQELGSVWTDFRYDDDVRCVVLTGAGSAFCAGADLAEMKDPKDPKWVDRRAELTMQLHLIFSKMITPVVTAINGAAMGGGAGLAIAGDIAVMAQGAKIGYPETKYGIVAAIVMANLVRQVGRKAAFELAALGEPIDARRALALGMVNRVVAGAGLMAEAMGFADKLAAVERPAMAQTKHLFHEVGDLPLEAALKRGRDVNKRMKNFEQLVRKPKK
jgi:enoyl-CoA hydratase/carnithine racemase